MLNDQAAALARAEALVDGELWRADRRMVALTVLRGLVCGMSWESGLVAGVTRAALAAAAGCSVRTVSRVVAWSIEVELLVCVETGATAEFLGTEANRAPSYVFTAPPQVVVDTVGNPPACSVDQLSPCRDRGLKKHQSAKTPAPSGAASGSGWPMFDRTDTPPERALAVDTLLERTGLSGRVVRWQARALLGPWFAAGWSVAGLLHALDHHPDRPDAPRGDATRAARDPLGVLGYRLAPWAGRVAEMPATLRAVDGNARRARVARSYKADIPVPPTVTLDCRPCPQVPPYTPQASAEVRAAARSELARALARPRWSR